jgi:hypothetical protein
MNKHLIIACFFAVVFLLRGDDAPTFDLFAGWGWSPFPYYSGYPCRYRYDPYWRAYPSVGLGVPLSRREALYPYDDYGYAPFWGYEYGVKINLNDKRHAPALSEGLLQPLPGSTPTELRDSQREKLWDRDIETLLGSSPSESKSTAPTNNAPTKLLIPKS